MINAVFEMRDLRFFDIGADQGFHELCRQDFGYTPAHAANRWFLATALALAPTLQAFSKIQEFFLALHEVVLISRTFRESISVCD